MGIKLPVFPRRGDNALEINLLVRSQSQEMNLLVVCHLPATVCRMCVNHSTSLLILPKGIMESMAKLHSMGGT
jgi:hypothetical protein